MLYADLHHKISMDATEAERSEDVLTSTVFGTLFVAGDWDVLRRWLARAGRKGSTAVLRPSVGGELDYWFWPRLAEAEPDVIIRFGALLVIVEAKYHSNKSGKAAQFGDAAELIVAKDQLAREWRSCQAGVHTYGYPPRLAAAIATCHERVLVYLVKRGRKARASRELEQSAGAIPAAALYLLTWEDLDHVLAADEGPRWVRDLRAYLKGRGLSAFRGFQATLATRPTVGLQRWHRRRSSPPGLRTAFALDQGNLLTRLAARGSQSLQRRNLWARVTPLERLPGLAALARRQSRFSKAETDHG